MKRNKGITLIVLVITIVIILILAGVVISLSLGNNGIFQRAKQVRDKYLVAENKEKEELEGIDIDKYVNGITSFEEMLAECGIKGQYTLEHLKNNTDGILEKVLSNTNAVNYIILNPNEYLEELVNSEVAVNILAKNENIKERIINNEIWINGIQNNSKAEIFDNNMKTIPIMTSANTPSGEVIASQWDGNRYPYLAFDENSNTGFFMYNGDTDKCNLIYKYDETKLIYKISAIIDNPSSAASDNIFKIYISSEESGENWQEIKSDEWNWASGVGGNNRKNETIILKKAQKVKRIKFYSYCYINGEICTQFIYEAQAYGI